MGTPEDNPSTNLNLTPEVIRPFPKAPMRSDRFQRMKKGILTETPEKNRIEESTLARNEAIKN